MEESCREDRLIIQKDTSPPSPFVQQRRWKLRPAQLRKGVGRKDQPGLFGDDLREDARSLMKLQVE